MKTKKNGKKWASSALPALGLVRTARIGGASAPGVVFPENWGRIGAQGRIPRVVMRGIAQNSYSEQ